MGVPTSEVGYTSAMPRREDHEVHKGHVVALEEEEYNLLDVFNSSLLRISLLKCEYMLLLGYVENILAENILIHLHV